MARYYHNSDLDYTYDTMKYPPWSNEQVNAVVSEYLYPSVKLRRHPDEYDPLADTDSSHHPDCECCKERNTYTRKRHHHHYQPQHTSGRAHSNGKGASNAPVNGKPADTKNVAVQVDDVLPSHSAFYDVAYDLRLYPRKRAANNPEVETRRGRQVAWSDEDEYWTRRDNSSLTLADYRYRTAMKRLDRQIDRL